MILCRGRAVERGRIVIIGSTSPCSTLVFHTLSFPSLIIRTHGCHINVVTSLPSAVLKGYFTIADCDWLSKIVRQEHSDYLSMWPKATSLHPFEFGLLSYDVCQLLFFSLTNKHLIKRIKKLKTCLCFCSKNI